MIEVMAIYRGKVRAEIERLKREARRELEECSNDSIIWVQQLSVCDRLLTYLDSLQDEPDIDSTRLRSKMRLSEDLFFELFEDSESRALEFFAEKYAMENFVAPDYYEDDYPDYIGVCEKAVKVGAYWMKKFMMKCGKVGNVMSSWKGRYVRTRYLSKEEMKELGIDYGDKVRVIIIKDENHERERN